MNNTDTALNSSTVTLSIRNDVIFKKVFSQKKIIQPFLEDVTKQKLDDIRIVNAEKTVYPSARARYNRFDVCLLNSGDVYDTEMQTGKFEDIIERAMHHASV
ncbi:MAG: PD-(D/E)XK nuclease family transposase, partial [Bulleidia sp.]|nr:PD-(D/E)XK nuclease family transposase [Bulleidia sp.]